MKKLWTTLALALLTSCAVLSELGAPSQTAVSAPPGTLVVLIGLSRTQTDTFWSATVDISRRQVVSTMTGSVSRDLSNFLGRLARSPCDSLGCRVVSSFISPPPPSPDSLGTSTAGLDTSQPATDGGTDGGAYDGGFVASGHDIEDKSGSGIPGDEMMKFAIQVYRTYQVNLAPSLKLRTATTLPSPSR
jgi:hypothetical protein